MRALVVDDSKPVRSIVTNVLRTLSFECSEAGNGREALDALATQERPDLMTINWHMPVMDGIELVRALRANPRYRACKLLMISTEHAPDRIAVARAAGVDGYVAKPFTAATLEREVAALGLARAVPVRQPAAVRVLVVDDSATVRNLLSKVLSEAAGIEVIGTAENGQAGVAAVARRAPDLVVLDVEMPVMDGIAALREIRKAHPRLPVIMFSSLTEKGARATLDALMAGANDYVTKPTGGPAEVAERIRGDLVDRIKALAGRQPLASSPSTASPAAAQPQRPRASVTGIVIGVSTGGPTALAELLPHFAAQAGVPILIVQHMPAFFTAQLAERLTRLIGCDVREAVHGQHIQPGGLLLAPGGKHLEVIKDGAFGRIRLTEAAPENSCRPAADVLFRTAAAVWGKGTLGIVLTGMGRDGLAGSRAIVDAGGSVLVQDEFTSVVWGMPGEVARAGLADAVLPLAQLGAEVGLRLRRRSSG